MLLDNAKNYKFKRCDQTKKEINRGIYITPKTADDTNLLLSILKNESIINFDINIISEIAYNCLFDKLNSFGDLEALEYLEQEAIKLNKTQRTLNRL